MDASVGIEGTDRAGLERLLRYCARPPFALEHLDQLDAEHLVYHCPKPGPDGLSALVLTPLELIDKIAALVPPPRLHRHRYYGVLAPNAPLRAAVTSLAPAAQIAPAPPPAAAVETANSVAAKEPPHCAVSRYRWAMLLARIYAVFPLTCPLCHAELRPAGSTLGVRIIAFINEACAVRRILDHLGEATRPPRFAPAGGRRSGTPQRLLHRRTTTRNGTWQPNRYRKSNSISALPGEEQLRVGYACVSGSTRGRFLVLTRPLLATTRRGAAQHRHFRAFEVANAQVANAQLTRVQRPWILEVVRLKFLCLPLR